MGRTNDAMERSHGSWQRQFGLNIRMDADLDHITHT